MSYELILGDCLEVMKMMPENSVDAICTDPPAGINFMNLKFDSDRGGRTAWIAWMTEIAAASLRLLKPGGHALVWALPRTSHWTATAWEDAGFEIRDCIYHIGGQGFPKGHDVSKAIDKHLGKEREVVGSKLGQPGYSHADNGCTNKVYGDFHDPIGECAVTAPATPEAAQWQGWNSALKPAVECWWLLRKPLSEPTIAANVLAWGCGGLNIDACRVGYGVDDMAARISRTGNRAGENLVNRGAVGFHNGYLAPVNPQGRWPANLIIGDDETAALLDEQSGVSRSIASNRGERHGAIYGNGKGPTGADGLRGHDDQGGASRYFLRVAPDAEVDEPLRIKYCSKASKRDRNSDGVVNNTHSTVKPQMLMRWLCKLICPPNGVVLDPFLGSGSTGVAAVLEGFSFIGIELDAEYLTIAAARIEHAASQVEAQMQMPLQLEAQP